jgi:hypothetical protein
MAAAAPNAFGGEPMENLLSALAFAGLIAAQFLSVVFVNTQRCEDPSPGARNRIARAPARGSLPHSDRKAFSWALGCLCDLLDGMQRNRHRAIGKSSQNSAVLERDRTGPMRIGPRYSRPSAEASGQVLFTPAADCRPPGWPTILHPRAVLIPRAVSARATPRSDCMPLALICWITGNTFAAN